MVCVDESSVAVLLSVVHLGQGWTFLVSGGGGAKCAGYTMNKGVEEVYRAECCGVKVQPAGQLRFIVDSEGWSLVVLHCVSKKTHQL